MNKEQYRQIEAYMISRMGDMVHDALHVYRVVNYAARICDRLEDADFDIVIAAALLHDVGRPAENADPSVCHAEAGSQMAYDFLTEQGYAKEFAERVRSCVLSHRRKKGVTPQSLEAKILFDADKLDLIGNMGAVRAILFGGQIGEPIYRVGGSGRPTCGAPDEDASLFREYHRKLSSLSEKLYTAPAREIAAAQQREMNAFFEALIAEVNRNYDLGEDVLGRQIQP